MIKQLKVIGIISIFLGITNCATYKTQSNPVTKGSTTNSSEVEHSFYLIGDAGNANENETLLSLEYLKQISQEANKNSTLLFLGDNVYPKGMPKKETEERTLAEHRLNVQLEVAKQFPGKTIFTPGNHDWYNGVKGVKRQEKLVEEALGKGSFLPEDGCPIKRIHVTEEIDLIIADTEWYLTDWDKQPTINDECEIKSRAQFLDELESYVKKARGKTTILMFHHPLLTNGTHGGNYAFKSHLTPAPVLGTLKNVIRKTSGVSPQDNQNKKYNNLIQRIETIASKNEKVIVVSGHDHNMQLIQHPDFVQIVSGSGSKQSPTKLQNANFVSSDLGFAKLNVHKDGSSSVEFYSANQKQKVYEQALFKSKNVVSKTYPTDFPKTKKATIYKDELVNKNRADRSAFGNRYRKLYGVPVEVPTVRLDTLFGGLTPVRKGGGNQSKSLRLRTKDGKEYVMRALKKEAVQYLQAFLFKTKNVSGKFEDTKTENLVLDIFAGSHPYGPFVVGDLADAVKIFHTNPTLYYVPKQNALSNFNNEFGNELYMIEERAADGHGNLESFGYSNELISTDDLFKNLRKNSKHKVDEDAYIRARLFDMVIGDWDRHSDQWRWAKFNEDEKTIYRPVPRDRDQAFSRISDGWLMGLVTLLVTDSRLLQNYEKDITDVKWFNVEPYPIDVALISESSKEDWDKQVKYIQENLTDNLIQKALDKLPPEVQDKSKDQIIDQLKTRVKNLQKISDQYFNVYSRIAVVRGTDKKDWIEIQRLPEGQTEVKIFTNKDGQKNKLHFHRVFNKEETKQIWLYALDGEDQISVNGEGNKRIKLVLVGGQNNDVYEIENAKNLKIYDFKSKKNTISKKGRTHLSDNYDLNTYDYKKPKYNKNQLFPILGSNPDDGFKIGFTDTYTVNNFKRNPFSSQYRLTAEYYFATSGLYLDFYSEFANIFGNFNLGLNATYTTPSYALNFFGFGNETANPEADDPDNFDLDFNRVRTRIFRFRPSIKRVGEFGSTIQFGLVAEDVEIDRSEDRFIESFIASNTIETNNQQLGAYAEYQFLNKDDALYPTLGFDFNLGVGGKYNNETEEPFGYVDSNLRIDHRLIHSGSLVLSSEVGGKVLIGNDYPFFEAANLGSNNGLRGFRQERFTGKQSFYQSTDLRYQFKGARTSWFPVRLGLFAGFDYGRVWQPEDPSRKWHNSYGGGAFINFAEIATLNLGWFSSSEDSQLLFQLGIGF